MSPALLWQSGATSSSIEISWDYDGVYDVAQKIDVWVDGSPTPVTVCDVGSTGPIGGCRSGKATLPTAFAACSAHTIVADPCWYDGTSSCPRAYETATITASTIGTSTATAPAALAATPTDFPTANSWIYTGTSAVQTVTQPPDANVFAGSSLAVIRGTVKTRTGDPVVCGRVNVVGHEEYGATTTLWDGSFALAVKGTSPVLLDIQGPVSSTLLPVQRRVVPRVHDYVWMDEARLTPYSGSGTQINSINRFVMGPSEPPGGTTTRRLAAFFPLGTTATVQGVTPALTIFSVRPVEYTVGAGGPAAMPGLLPPASGYTFAASFELAGYERKPVTFSGPVFLYVDNWASVPNGTQVPNGTYNETLGVWLPEANGRVVKIKDCSGGYANVATGTDATIADNTGINPDERAQLALMYPEACGTDAGPGSGSLWRFQVNHFSSFDWNFALRSAVGAVAPGVINLLTGDTTAPGCRAGSIIECENQTLGEMLPVAGTPFSLVYSSARQPGRWREITASVEKPTTGPAIKRVEAEATIAGQKLAASAVFETTTDKTYYQVGFRWDGRDLAGRLLNGRHRAHVKIGFVYPADYLTVTSFGDPAAMSTSPAISFSADESRKEATLYREAEVWVDTWSDAIQGLGGWSLSPVHYFDTESNTLYRGDGSLIHASPGDANIETVAGGGTSEPTSGALARSVWLPYELTALTVGGDGSVYYGTSESAPSRDGIWKIQPDSASSGDGFATARVYRITDRRTHGIAVDASDRIFYSSPDDDRIYRFDPTTGSTVSVAGTGVSGAGADGLASASALSDPRDLSLSPDGTLYFFDDGNDRVRRIVFGPTATVQTVAGGGSLTADGSKARDLSLPSINSIAVRSNGDLFIATQANIWRVGPDGYASVVAGVTGSTTGGAPVDGALAKDVSLSAIRKMGIGPDGTVFFTYYGYPTNCRLYRLEADSVLRVVGGAGACATEITDGGRAVEAKLDGEPSPIAIDSRGNVFLGNPGQSGTFATHRVVRIATGVRTTLVGSERHVPSSDGREVYVFNSKGVIQRTIDAFTGRTIFRFDHATLDPTRLTRIEDAFGNALDINRIGSSNIELASSPDGLKSKLFLTGGYLTRFEDAEDRPSTFVYDTGGLMREYRDVIANATSGDAYQFTYDADGRLYSDGHPVAPWSPQILSRSTNPRGWTVNVYSAAGRLMSYAVETDDKGNRVKKRTVTTAVDTTTEDFAGTFIERTSPAGATFKSQFKPDPRFGQLASFVKQFEFKASPTRTPTITTLDRTVVPATATGSGNATSVTDSYTWNDGVVRTFAVTTEKISTTGGARVHAVLPSNSFFDFEYVPSGSTTSLATDRLVKVATAGVDDVRVAYDTRGRVTAMQQGSACPALSDPHPATDCVTGPAAVPLGCRRISLGYHATNGNLACAFDGLGLLFRQTPDKLGRPTSLTLPYGPSASAPSYRTVTLTYSNNGTTQASVPIAVSGSTSAMHTFSIDRPMRKVSYEAPSIAAGPTINSLTVGVDHETTAVAGVEPWANLSVNYWSDVLRPFYTSFGGNMPGADYFADYFEFYADGRPWLASRLRNHLYEWETYGTRAYDGLLATDSRSVYYAGSFTLDRTVTRTFDSRLRVETEQLTTAPTATYVYGPDGHISSVAAGGKTLTIDRLWSGTPRADGAVSATTLGITTESFRRSGFAEVLGDRDGSDNAITSAWGADYTVSGARVLGFTYSRDARGRITKLTETIVAAPGMPAHTRTTNYTYRRDGGLERVVVRDGLNGNIGTIVRDVSYNYDVNGNIDLGGTYDAQDRLVTMSGGYGFAQHDRDGRMTNKNYDCYYWYDSHDQLTDVARYDWSTYTWKYIRYRQDASGRRTTRTQDGVSGVTSYVYEDGALLPIAEYLDSTLVWRFVYGSKPNIPEFAIRGDGTVYRIFSDHLGSPRLVVNTTSGAIVQRMDYDEWGNVTEYILPGFSPIPFGFAGGLYDRLTGLVHFGARDYDPILHRWITKDNAGFDAGTNFYAYANNDPVNLIDPEGTIPIAPMVAGFVWGFGGDVAWQLVANGGNWGCIDYKSAAIAGGMGAIGGALSFVGKAAHAKGVWGQWNWSHFFPERLAKKTGFKGIRGLPNNINQAIHYGIKRVVDSELNGNYVPVVFHYATDNIAFNFVPKVFKPNIARYMPGVQQALRVPGWFAGGAAGIAAQAGSETCGCR